MVGPSLSAADFLRFYGLGGGFTWAVSRHLGIRTSADYVHCFLFKDMLAHPRNTLRVAMGPTFYFGSSVVR
jgi:hypothetical protein